MLKIYRRNLNFLMKIIQETITPIDGRYARQTQLLVNYFSETALAKYRIMVEVDYLKELSQYKIINLTSKELNLINGINEKFNQNEFKKVKEIEEKINHDVKAVEYYLRYKFEKQSLKKIIPFIHFGLTSEDINNLAYALMLKDCQKEIILPRLKNLLDQLKQLIRLTVRSSILARTHGQPAVATTFGKEIANYYYRLQKQFKKLKRFLFEGKCNGAVGNFNAAYLVYPKINWIKFSQDFVEGLGLKPNLYTTQILPYDNWLEYFQIIMLINGIFVDFSINIWQYIMLNILQQRLNIDKVGSSTMPQKINPIDFEGAEGNLQLANSLFEFFQRKLICSRLQRDLSDSSVRRSFGTAIGHTILGWKSIVRGLKKISVNRKFSQDELNNHWEILTEAIQTFLRSTRNQTAYENLQTLTQGKTLTKQLYFTLLKSLHLDKEKKLINLSPEKYIGLAEKLTKLIINSK